MGTPDPVVSRSGKSERNEGGAGRLMGEKDGVGALEGLGDCSGSCRRMPGMPYAGMWGGGRLLGGGWR